jgi:hypothetical protein
MREKTHANMTASDSVETISDAWAQFERAVDTVVKSGPQHRSKKRKAAADQGTRGGPVDKPPMDSTQ